MAKPPAPGTPHQALVGRVAARSLRVGFAPEGVTGRRGSAHIITKIMEEKTAAEEGQQHVFGWKMSRVSVTDPAERRKTDPYCLKRACLRSQPITPKLRTQRDQGPQEKGANHKARSKVCPQSCNTPSLHRTAR